MASEISSRVRAMPSWGCRSTVAAYRAPSVAAAVRVLRTCSTSATWMSPSTKGTRTRLTRTKSTTAAPWSARDRRERVTKHRAQLGAGNRPEARDQTGTHHGDQDPTGDVPALVSTPTFPRPLPHVAFSLSGASRHHEAQADQARPEC